MKSYLPTICCSPEFLIHPAARSKASGPFPGPLNIDTECRFLSRDGPVWRFVAPPCRICVWREPALRGTFLQAAEPGRDKASGPKFGRVGAPTKAGIFFAGGFVCI